MSTPVRACNCPGMVDRLRVAFDQRIRGWEQLGRQERKPEVAVHIQCVECRRVYRLQLLELGFIPASRGL